MRDLSCCGTDCKTCGCYGDLCKGCNASEGKVFHAPEGKACPIYACAVNEKGLKSCGQCQEVPCAIWKDTRDPAFSDDEFAANIEKRLETLRKITLD